MRTEHRHELKTNELAEWIINLPQRAKANLKMIIFASVVVVLAAGLYIWLRYQKNVVSVQKQLQLTTLITQLPRSKIQIVTARSEGVDISYMLLQATDRLQTAAAEAKDDTVAALALIKQAETLRSELHYRSGTVGKRDVEAAINQAKAAYSEALSRVAGPDGRGTTNPSLTAMAKFGLGLCEEELGNFAQAEQIYRDISTAPDFEATTAAAAAKHRLETMANYQQEIVFKQPPLKSQPKPTPPELIQPQIELKTPDSNSLLLGPNNTARAPVSRQPEAGASQ